jgi:hypothetical protein
MSLKEPFAQLKLSNRPTASKNRQSNPDDDFWNLAEEEGFEPPDESPR